MSIKRKIAIHRPGALGDVLITLNIIPFLKKKYEGYAIDYYTAMTPLKELYDFVGINEVLPQALCYTPEVRARYDVVYTPMGYPLKEGYPEVKMRKHLLQHFADDLGIDVGNTLPALELKRETPLVHGSYVTIHPQAGWSLYKNWPFDRWEKVIAAFPRVKFVQIGAEKDFKLRGADTSFMGKTVMEAINLISNAAFHVGVDSFSNHVTHLKFDGKQTPAVILFGSTQHDASGYPHNINVSLNLPCQPCFKEDPVLSYHPRGVCINPPGQTSYHEPRHACMHNLEPDHVINIVKHMIQKHIS